jgi:hypothetical protein
MRKKVTGGITKVIFKGQPMQLHYSYEHRNRPRQISLCAVRSTRNFLRLREILLSLPGRGHSHVRGWPDVLRGLP